MTTLNVTITPDRAVMSQDQAIWYYQDGELGAAETGITASAEEAVTKTFHGDGSLIDDVTPCLVEKITCLPERRMLIGMSGAAMHSHRWPEWLDQDFPEGDISEIAEHVPALLRELVRLVPSKLDELLIVHAGWSQSEGRVIGYAYDRADDFQPVRLDRGHTMMPVANPNAPDYEALYALWEPATNGEGVERFHDALQRNQYWSYKQGLLRRGVHLSDTYSMASVDAHGAAMLVDKLVEAA